MASVSSGSPGRTMEDNMRETRELLTENTSALEEMLLTGKIAQLPAIAPDGITVHSTYDGLMSLSREALCEEVTRLRDRLSREEDIRARLARSMAALKVTNVEMEEGITTEQHKVAGLNAENDALRDRITELEKLLALGNGNESTEMVHELRLRVDHLEKLNALLETQKATLTGEWEALQAASAAAKQAHEEDKEAWRLREIAFRESMTLKDEDIERLEAEKELVMEELDELQDSAADNSTLVELTHEVDMLRQQVKDLEGAEEYEEADIAALKVAVLVEEEEGLTDHQRMERTLKFQEAELVKLENRNNELEQRLEEYMSAAGGDSRTRTQYEAALTHYMNLCEELNQRVALLEAELETEKTQREMFESKHRAEVAAHGRTQKELVDRELEAKRWHDRHDTVLATKDALESNRSQMELLLEEMKNSLSEAEYQRIQAKYELTEAQRTVDTVSTVQTEMERKMNAAEDKLAQSQQTYEVLLSQKNILESQVNELRRDLTLERFEHAATRERLEERTVGLSDAHAAMEELAELRRQLEQQIAEHHVEFGKGENSAASFRVKIATLERQVEHYKAQYVDMKDQWTSLSRETRVLANELESAVLERDNANKQLALAKGTLHTLVKEKNQLSAQVEAAEDEFRAMQHGKHEAEAATAQTEARLGEAREEVIDLQRRLDTVEAQREELLRSSMDATSASFREHATEVAGHKLDKLSLEQATHDSLKRVDLLAQENAWLREEIERDRKFYQEEIQRALAAKADVQKDVTALQTTLERVSEESMDKFRSYENELAFYSRHVHEERIQDEELKNELSRTTATLAAMQVTVDEEREARARTEEEVNTLHERYSDFEAERERMDLTNSELARQIKHLEGMRDRLSDEKGALEKEVDRIKAHLEDRDEELAVLRKQLLHIEAHSSDEENARRLAQMEADRTTGKYGALTERIEELEAALEGDRRKRLELEAEVNNLNLQLEAAGIEIDEHKNKVREVLRSRSEFAIRAEELEQELMHLSSELERSHLSQSLRDSIGRGGDSSYSRR